MCFRKKEKENKEQKSFEQDAIPRTTAPKLRGTPRMSYRAANLQEIGQRERQEDSFAFGNALDANAAEESGLLMIVADGMGGMKDGRLASQTAIERIRAGFHSMEPSDDIPAQLESIILSAGKAVEQALGGGGGSTVVVGVVFQQKLYMASVGDSYAFLLRNMELVRLNRSHNVLNRDLLEEISRGGFDPNEAKRNPEKEALTQFLGMSDFDEIDRFRRPLHLQAGDVILLCSDGVGGVLSEQCIAECISHGSPEDMCAALKKEVQNVGSRYQDNYTALVLQCIQ